MPNFFQYWTDYLWSLGAAKRQKQTFEQVQTYCMFIGHGRSGHTLYAALLNAHPEIVVSNELDSLGYVERGISRDQLYALILKRDRWFTDKGSRWGEFNYRVPNQWQGRFQKLKVIGDKRGGHSTMYFHRSPELLSKLRQTVRAPVKIIHAIRNPFDNITTFARRNGIGLQESIERYFLRTRTNARMLEICPADIITVRHEDFIARPDEQLKRLANFLGCECENDYLSHCVGIVVTSPSKSRLKADWNAALIDQVQVEIEKHRFLSGYSFES